MGQIFDIADFNFFRLKSKSACQKGLQHQDWRGELNDLNVHYAPKSKALLDLRADLPLGLDMRKCASIWKMRVVRSRALNAFMHEGIKGFTGLVDQAEISVENLVDHRACGTREFVFGCQNANHALIRMRLKLTTVPWDIAVSPH